MAVLLKMQVFSDMVLCCWASAQRFRELQCLLLQGQANVSTLQPLFYNM